MKTALVAIAGAGGALARYGIGVVFGGRTFPWATLGINLTGSLVLGFLLKFSLDRGWADTATVPLAIGFIGSFTTFSTFSSETFDLARHDRTAIAAAYVTASVVGGVLAALVGYLTARRLT